MNNPKQKISILALSLDSGGAEKVISLLLKELKNDFSVTLVLLYNVIHFPIPKSVDVVILSNKKYPSSRITKFSDFFGFARKYNKLLKQKKIQTSISFLALPNFINGIVSIFNRKTKTIISERGFPTDNTNNKLSFYISKFFYPLFYNKCTKLFSNSIYINEDLRNNFSIKIPMDVIYNPIELPTSVITAKSLNVNLGVLNIITAGTLNKRKNHKMIIKAIMQNISSYQLTILGEGPLKNVLTQQIKDNNLQDKVFLLGNVKHVNDYFLKNQCFVLSSFTEGFPNALLEALAIGLPCISTNCLSGPLEMLNENEKVVIENGSFYKGRYGLLINNDDNRGLYNALEYFRTKPEERERYAKLSLQRAKKYELKNIYIKFQQFLIN